MKNVESANTLLGRIKFTYTEGTLGIGTKIRLIIIIWNMTSLLTFCLRFASVVGQYLFMSSLLVTYS